MMWGILLVGLIAIGLIIEGYGTFCQMRTNPWRLQCPGYQNIIKPVINEKAIKFASSVTTPLAKVVLAVLQKSWKRKKKMSARRLMKSF